MDLKVLLYLKKLSESVAHSQKCIGLNLSLLQWELSRLWTTYKYTSMLPEDKWLLLCLLNNMTIKLMLLNCFIGRTSKMLP